MSFNLTVLYPNNSDTEFNFDYYLSYHMPLAEKAWKHAGLLKWEMIKFDAGADGQKPPFCVANVMTWIDRASYEAASKLTDTYAVFADLPNVCNYAPTIMLGNFAAKGQI